MKKFSFIKSGWLYLISFFWLAPIIAGPPPDYGTLANIQSVKSGSWSDSTVWSLGRIPTANDGVKIIAGHTVTYDLVSDQSLSCVVVEGQGELRFRTTGDTRMKVGTVMVKPNGTLRIGDVANPMPVGVKAQLMFADRAIDTNFDPEFFGGGLIMLGNLITHGAVMSPTFARLATENRTGDTGLPLAVSVSGWKTGDTVWIPDTDIPLTREERLNPNRVFKDEYAQLSGSSGQALSLTSPLLYNHPGILDQNNALAYTPHVLNLTRNVTIESENPLGHRGHVYVFGAIATLDLRYTALESLGRTSIRKYNNTTFDGNGNVISLGTNQLGRFPLHIYNLGRTPVPGPVRFTLEGNVVRGNARPMDPDTKFYGIYIFNSGNGRLSKNIIHRVGGTGIHFEDDDRGWCQVNDNFVGYIVGSGASSANSDHPRGSGGFGYLMDSPHQALTNNVAAMIGLITGPNVLDYWESGFYLSPNGNDPGLDRAPNIPIPPGYWDRNKAYNVNTGVRVERLQHYGQQADKAISVIKNQEVWKVHESAFNGGGVNWLTLEDCVFINPFQSDRAIGILFGPYYGRDTVFRNCKLIGFRAGIIALTNTTGSGLMTMINPVFCSWTGVVIRNIHLYPGGSSAKTPRYLDFVNPVFLPLPIAIVPPGSPVSNIYVDANSKESYANHMMLSIVRVYDYNGVRGNNFGIYGKEQFKGFVPPASFGTSFVGSPEAGLTNTQLWDKYGQAVARSISPCETEACLNALPLTSTELTNGFAFPLGAGLKLEFGFPQNNQILDSQVIRTVWRVVGDLGEPVKARIKLDDRPEMEVGFDAGPLTYSDVPSGTHILSGYLVDIDGNKVPGSEALVNFRTGTGGAPSPNEPPVVDAGADTVITFPAFANLNGTQTDDGLPNPPARVVATWSKVSGPGTVTFGDPNALQTTASFSQAGAYVLSLSATDGELTAASEVTITVNPQSSTNQPPSVNAGPDQTIAFPAAANLDGTTVDDGLPIPPGRVTSTWSKVSGPGTVTFENRNAVDTVAGFSAPGEYEFKLLATDGAFDAEDFVTIMVNPENQQPTVNAGADIEITLPAKAKLLGTATDDGFPNPPGSLAINWNTVSGPGEVSYSNRLSLLSEATFGAAGSYVLRLTASDGAVSVSDDMNVTVKSNSIGGGGRGAQGQSGLQRGAFNPDVGPLETECVGEGEVFDRTRHFVDRVENGLWDGFVNGKRAAAETYYIRCKDGGKLHKAVLHH